MPRGNTINIQDGFLFALLKERRQVSIRLVAGDEMEGQISRFDRYAIILRTDGSEILIYKHALATIEDLSGAASVVRPEERRPRHDEWHAPKDNRASRRRRSEHV